MKRTAAPGLKADEGAMLSFKKAGVELRRVCEARLAPVERMEYHQVVATYTGRLAKRYEIARKSLIDDGYVGPEDAMIDAFVKAEKFNPASKVSKPRLIMGRTPRYNLELASYLKPYEHVLYGALRGYGNLYASTTRWVAKGLNGGERASLIRRKMGHFRDVRVMEVDGKAFEAHFSKEILEEEHRWYNGHYKSDNLARLLSYQLEVRGRTRNGLRYRIPGVRASGDFNTGLGNSLVMCSLVNFTGRTLKTRGSIKHRFDMMVDGDNALIFVEADELGVWEENLPGVFESVGFEATLSEPTGCLERVEFGQSRPVWGPAGWTMVRNPFKVMSNAYSSYRHYNDLKGGIKVLKCVAQCEAVLNAGIPVLQEFAHAMLIATRGASYARRFEAESYEYQRVVHSDSWSAQHYQSVGMRSRLSFAKAWGIDIEEQQRLEKSFKVTLPTSWAQVPIDSVDGSVCCPWDFDQTEAASRWIDEHAT